MSEVQNLSVKRLLRVTEIVRPKGPLPISKSSWWAGAKSGAYPQPVRGLSKGVTAWWERDILALLNGLEEGEK